MKPSSTTRTAFLIATLGALTAPALAGKARTPTKPVVAAVEKPKKPNLGDAYELKRLDRRSKLPTASDDTMVIVTRSLTPAQVAQVVKDRKNDVEYCWQRLAIMERMPCTAMLKLSIDVKGAVTKLDVAGDAPPSVAKCISETAAHWTFPVAEASTEIAYPVALRSL